MAISQELKNKNEKQTHLDFHIHSLNFLKNKQKMTEIF